MAAASEGRGRNARKGRRIAMEPSIIDDTLAALHNTAHEALRGTDGRSGGGCPQRRLGPTRTGRLVPADTAGASRHHLLGAERDRRAAGTARRAGPSVMRDHVEVDI